MENTNIVREHNTNQSIVIWKIDFISGKRGNIKTLELNKMWHLEEGLKFKLN